MQAALEMVGRGGTTGHAWIAIVGTTSSSGGSRPRPRNGPRETVIRTEASPFGPSSPSAASSSAIPSARRRRGRPAAGCRGRPPSDAGGRRARPARSDAPPRTRSVSKTPSPSWKPRSKTDRCGPSAGSRRPSTQTWPTVAAPRRPGSLTPTSTAADRPQRPARLGHGLVPFGGRVALPGDAAADVEGQPPAVRHEGPDDDAGLHRAVRPDPADGAGVRAAPDGLETLEDLHRPDLRGARDGAARERRREQVEGVAARRQGRRSRSRRGAGPRPSARAGTAAGRGRCPAGRRGRGRCAGRRRSSRSRRDPWRSTAARARARGPRPRRGRAGACP